MNNSIILIESSVNVIKFCDCSSLVQLKAIVRHSETSNRELNNAIVRFILPPYLTPDLKVTASKDIMQVATPNGVVDVIVCRL